jgi:hypothetical protein
LERALTTDLADSELARVALVFERLEHHPDSAWLTADEQEVRHDCRHLVDELARRLGLPWPQWMLRLIVRLAEVDEYTQYNARDLAEQMRNLLERRRQRAVEPGKSGEELVIEAAVLALLSQQCTALLSASQRGDFARLRRELEHPARLRLADSA